MLVSELIQSLYSKNWQKRIITKVQNLGVCINSTATLALQSFLSLHLTKVHSTLQNQVTDYDSFQQNLQLDNRQESFQHPTNECIKTGIRGTITDTSDRYCHSTHSSSSIQETGTDDLPNESTGAESLNELDRSTVERSSNESEESAESGSESDVSGLDLVFPDLNGYFDEHDRVSKESRELSRKSRELSRKSRELSRETTRICIEGLKGIADGLHKVFGKYSNDVLPDTFESGTENLQTRVDLSKGEFLESNAELVQNLLPPQSSRTTQQQQQD